MEQIISEMLRTGWVIDIYMLGDTIYMNVHYKDGTKKDISAKGNNLLDVVMGVHAKTLRA